MDENLAVFVIKKKVITLENFIMRNSKFLFYFLFCFLILGYSCSDRSASRNAKSKKTNASTSKIKNASSSAANQKNKVNFYIENSGSMKYYLTNALDTSYSKFVSQAIIEIPDSSFDKNCFFIGDGVQSIKQKTKINVNLKDFMSWIKQDYYDVQSTKLQDLINEVLDSTNQNTVSIFVSDLIFSFEHKNASKGLNSVGQSIQNNIQNKINLLGNNNFSAVIYKMMVPFDGWYFKRNYDKNHKDEKVDLDNKLRPFYFLIFGNPDLVDKITSDPRAFNGYNAKSEFSTIDYKKRFQNNGKSYWSVLPSTNKIGKFKPVSKKGANRVMEIQSVEKSRREKESVMQLSVALDLSEIPVSDKYLLDTSNYKINSKDGYKIKSVNKFDRSKIKPSDIKYVKNKNGKYIPTHVMLIESKANAFPNINIKLKRCMPKELESSFGGVYEDDNVATNLDKTFGMKYLVEGLYKAFNKNRIDKNGEDYYFDITIPVSAKKSSGGGGWIIFGVIVGILLLFFAILYRKKQRKTKK